MRTLLVAVAFSALAQTYTGSESDSAPPPDEVIQAALTVASDQLQVDTDHLVVMATESHDWPDNSLGCPRPGLAYAQIITPGYLVTIDTDDGASEVAVHTDRVGQRVVIC